MRPIATEISAAPSISEVSAVEFRVNNFDILRILAATQVLIFHSLDRLKVGVPSWIAPLALFPGVPIFFVISGYLVSASYERQVGVSRYLKNRFLRIFPGLWACIGTTVVVVLAFGYRFVHVLDFAWLPAQFLGIIYTPSFLKSFGFGSYNGALWTIPLELQFYVALIFVYRAVRSWQLGNRSLLMIFGIFAGLSLWIAYSHPEMGGANESSLEKLLRYSFLPSFYLFLLGMVMQRFRIFRSPVIAGKGLLWVAGYILVRTAIPQSAAVDLISSVLLGIAMISVAYTLPRASEIILRGQDISYGVYIYHGLIINVMVELGLTHRASHVILVLLSAYAVGAVSWMVVERRFLQKKIQTIHNR